MTVQTLASSQQFLQQSSTMFEKVCAREPATTADNQQQLVQLQQHNRGQQAVISAD